MNLILVLHSNRYQFPLFVLSQDVGETASSGSKLDVELKLFHEGLNRKSPRAKREGVKRTYSRTLSSGSFKRKGTATIFEEENRCLNRMPVPQFKIDAASLRAFKSIQGAPIRIHPAQTLLVKTGRLCLYPCCLYRFKRP